jgi:hypothetical protein
MRSIFVATAVTAVVLGACALNEDSDFAPSMSVGHSENPSADAELVAQCTALLNGQAIIASRVTSDAHWGNIVRMDVAPPANAGSSFFRIVCWRTDDKRIVFLNTPGHGLMPL